MWRNTIENLLHFCIIFDNMPNGVHKEVYYVSQDRLWEINSRVNYIKSDERIWLRRHVTRDTQ
jgi:hypothetical protein